MNTKNLKAYAPKARREFIDAIKKRAASFGIYEKSIAPVVMSGDGALIEQRMFSRRQGEQRQALERKVAARGYDLFIREIAYTWFNRLAAIRYMELHDYLGHGYRVLSHPKGQGYSPEILGHGFDVAESLALDKHHITELQLAGDKEEQLFRELLLGQCHYLHKVMPFMFEPLDDASELLLPDNLTKTDSILTGLINDIPEEDWQDIEVIGWLYQFYISEYKDAVIGKVVKSEDIPAATQLFTPNWIVKYLVQNSLGRQWLATYPDAELKGKMAYYIEPAEQSDEVVAQLKAITPNSIDPEQIKVLDPAAGSGHILVEVYEVLKEIYLERGYRLREIPELILTKNIYGLDIDDRAAQLAGFALMMKAREDDRRIFDRVESGDVKLNVFAVQSTEGLKTEALWQQLNLTGAITNNSTADLFAEPQAYDPPVDTELGQHYVMLDVLLEAFLPAKTLGSLIDIERFMADKHDQMRRAIDKLVSQKNKLVQQLKKLTGDNKATAELEQQIADLEAQIYQQTQIANHYQQVANNHLTLIQDLLEKLNTLTTASDPVASEAANTLMPILLQAKTLAQKYDVVVANPPYMGGKGMQADVRKFLKTTYEFESQDVYAAFVTRSLSMLIEGGSLGFVTMHSWMFFPTFEKFRERIISNYRIETLCHLGARAFPEITGEVVQSAAFVISKTEVSNFLPSFQDLREGTGIAKKYLLHQKGKGFSNLTLKDFGAIPGSALAYFLTKSNTKLFSLPKLKDFANIKGGIGTSDNARFLRYWSEVCFDDIAFRISSKEEGIQSRKKWFTYEKGGGYRKWYGNKELVVNWKNDGEEIKDAVVNNPSDPHTKHWSRRIFNTEWFFKPSLTWSDIGTGELSVRKNDTGFIHDAVGVGVYDLSNDIDEFELLAILNSKVTSYFLAFLCPGTHFKPGQVGVIPIVQGQAAELVDKAKMLYSIAKADWDSRETSWDYCGNEFFFVSKEYALLQTGYSYYRKLKKGVLEEALTLELQINEILIQRYDISGLIELSRNELAISLDCNPDYIFNGATDGEGRYLSKSLIDLLSYSIGTMMGRYSLDREGLVYAHSGNEGFKELVAEGAYKAFPADDDGIIPLACEEWFFDDDATTRFREFVKVVWGAEHLQENLDFVAQSLCLHALKPKSGEGAMDTIRRYFSTQFFKDHCKTYKNRPIYWLFSSGKEKAFECLVYLHRYNESTLARMRTEYATPLLGKYDAQYDLLLKQKQSATPAEIRQIDRELKALEKKQVELRAYDEQLKYYAELKLSLDLDDGVKVNYGKFGSLLADAKTIHGKQPEIANYDKQN